MTGEGADHADHPESDTAKNSNANPGESPALSAVLGGGLAKAVRAGAEGEELSASGVFAAIGGVRGVVEAILPSFLFLVLFIITQDARISALVPGALAILLVIVRLFQGQTIISALSGVLGVGIAVVITLVTGRGVDYFLSGFFINIGWALGLLVTLVIGRPAIGLLIGMLDGDFSSWRRNQRVRRTATWLTLLWLSLFILRLAVQVPLYIAERVEALGVARIAMGVPLFACVIVVTWFVIHKARQSSDED